MLAGVIGRIYPKHSFRSWDGPIPRNPSSYLLVETLAEWIRPYTDLYPFVALLAERTQSIPCGHGAGSIRPYLDSYLVTGRVEFIRPNIPKAFPAVI